MSERFTRTSLLVTPYGSQVKTVRPGSLNPLWAGCSAGGGGRWGSRGGCPSLAPPIPAPGWTRVAFRVCALGSGCLGHAGLNSQEALGPEGKKGPPYSQKLPTFSGYPFCAAGGPAETHSSWGRGDKRRLGRLALGVGGEFQQNSQREASWLLLPGAEEAAWRPGVLPAAGRRWAGGVLTSPVRGHCGASS